MARGPVFDPTQRPAFAEQWRRYDFSLLRDSPVHRFATAEGLRRAGAELTALGYLVRELDTAGWTSAADLHAALAQALSFPGYYGANLDALADVLGEVAEYAYGSDPGTTGTALLIYGYQRLTELDRELAQAVLDVYAGAARFAALLGHPMLCLVEATTGFDPVGATAVALARPPV